MLPYIRKDAIIILAIDLILTFKGTSKNLENDSS
jgi:hypothetical protein